MSKKVTIKPYIIQGLNFNKQVERHTLLLFLRDYKKSADLADMVGGYWGFSTYNKLVRSVKSKRDLSTITKLEKEILEELIKSGDFSDWLRNYKGSFMGLLNHTDPDLRVIKIPR